MAQIYMQKKKKKKLTLEFCGQLVLGLEWRNIGDLVQSAVKLSEDPIACRVIISYKAKLKYVADPNMSSVQTPQRL